MSESSHLLSRTVLVTGGSGGIGTAIVEELREKKYDVIAPSSKELDLSDTDSVQSWCLKNQAVDFYGIVLSAAINQISQFETIDDSIFRRHMEINLDSNWKLLNTFIPKMKRNNIGRVVAISSSYSHLSRSGRSSYSISKAGLEALIRSVSVEYAQFDIDCNIIVPGFIDTPLTAQNLSPANLIKTQERIPKQRLGKPREVARLVTFLLDPETTYITGQKIHIDGGYSIN